MKGDPLDIQAYLRKNVPVPVTLINTRDCFAYDLKFTETNMGLKERPDLVKKEYHFDPKINGGYPDNFKQVLGLSKNADMSKIENLKIGVTCYENFYTH